MKLGANYTREYTEFAVFSPIADTVNVCLYEKGNGGTCYKKIEMEKTDSNEPDVFFCKVKGDLDGVYYTYEICSDKKSHESHDPYARAAGVNGSRSMVIDLSKTNPDGFLDEKRPVLENKTDMIVSEISVLDISSDKSANSKYPGKYKAFKEDNILDYFKDLKVTHLQIMPSYDFGSIDESEPEKEQYNWGYDPYNYNVPEGSFSTDPFNGDVRVKEFKEMIQAIHSAGYGVIMDVVYNHTYDVYGSCFYKTSGDYFYRKDGDRYSDASACGNEIASERPYVRKYIIDSLLYWEKEYHIDGFRFDLMGVLDIETMNLAAEALKKVNPNIILYGEGWTGADSVLSFEKRAMKVNAPQMMEFGMFSDDIRDAVKGHVFELERLGFANGAENMEEKIREVVVGSEWAKEPYQSINYLSCHDNNTLWDRLYVSSPDASEKERLCMNKLAASILFTAQGIPFFLMGEEFARTKPIEGTNEVSENSFNLPLYTNSIKYDRAKEFHELREYYKGLMELRTAHRGFKLTTSKEIKDAVNFYEIEQKRVVSYIIRTKNEDIFVVYNASNKEYETKLPDGRSWNVFVDNKKAGNKSLYAINNQAKIPAVSCLVAIAHN